MTPKSNIENDDIKIVRKEEDPKAQTTPSTPVPFRPDPTLFVLISPLFPSPLLSPSPYQPLHPTSRVIIPRHINQIRQVRPSRPPGIRLGPTRQPALPCQQPDEIGPVGPPAENGGPGVAWGCAGGVFCY